MTISDDRLCDLRALCEKASRGPWRHERDDGEVDSFVLHKAAGFDDVIVCQVGDTFQSNYMDGDFIASCREALPELLDEVDCLRDKLGESKANHNNLKNVYKDAEAEVKALREYVDLMIEQFDRVKGIAAAHGWCGDKDLWERAQPLRKLLGYEDV